MAGSPPPNVMKHDEAYTDLHQTVAGSFLVAFVPVKKHGPWGICGPVCGGDSFDPV